MMQYDASQVRINIGLKNIHLLNEKDGHSLVHNTNIVEFYGPTSVWPTMK